MPNPKHPSSRREDCSPTSCAAEAGSFFQGAPPSELKGIARRTFIVQSAMLAATAALAACGAAGDATSPDIPTSTSGGSTGGTPSNVITIANYPALAAVGGIAMLAIGSVRLAVVRTGESSFTALSRVCPHQGGTIQQSGTGFRCPDHGATFSSTGVWTGGQRTSNMRSYTTAYDATAGTLTIS